MVSARRRLFAHALDTHRDPQRFAGQGHAAALSIDKTVPVLLLCDEIAEAMGTVTLPKGRGQLALKAAIEAEPGAPVLK